MRTFKRLSLTNTSIIHECAVWTSLESAVLSWARNHDVVLLKNDGSQLDLNVVNKDQDAVISVFFTDASGAIAVDVLTGGWGCRRSFDCDLPSLEATLDQALAFSRGMAAGELAGVDYRARQLPMDMI